MKRIILVCGLLVLALVILNLVPMRVSMRDDWSVYASTNIRTRGLDLNIDQPRTKTGYVWFETSITTTPAVVIDTTTYSANPTTIYLRKLVLENTSGTDWTVCFYSSDTIKIGSYIADTGTKTEYNLEDQEVVIKTVNTGAGRLRIDCSSTQASGSVDTKLYYFK